MPKKDFAKELKEEFAKGNLKPSQLKRSKSSENIATLKPDIPLQKSKSAQEINLPPKLSLTEQVKQLKQELTFAQNNSQIYLTSLGQITAELDNTKEELKELQKVNNQLVDKNNELRLQALKDDDKIKEHDKELEKSVNKLVATEQTQINYKVQNSQLLREKKDLENQLKNSQSRIQKLYQLKGLPNTAQSSLFPSFRTLLLTGLLIIATIYILKKE